MSGGEAPAEAGGLMVRRTPGKEDSAAIRVAADLVHGGAS